MSHELGTTIVVGSGSASAPVPDAAGFTRGAPHAGWLARTIAFSVIVLIAIPVAALVLLIAAILAMGILAAMAVGRLQRRRMSTAREDGRENVRVIRSPGGR